MKNRDNDTQEWDSCRHIFLIGFMAVGKTTVGGLLGQMLGRPVIELDQRIEEMQQKTIPQIFDECGETCFRRMESLALESTAQEPPSVVSCGGGTVLLASNRQWMKHHGKVVLLEASPETILRRAENNSQRPLLQNRKDISTISQMLEQRKFAYAEAAHCTVSTEHSAPQQVCEQVAKLLGGYPYEENREKADKTELSGQE